MRLSLSAVLGALSTLGVGLALPGPIRHVQPYAPTRSRTRGPVRPAGTKIARLAAKGRCGLR